MSTLTNLGNALVDVETWYKIEHGEIFYYLFFSFSVREQQQQPRIDKHFFLYWSIDAHFFLPIIKLNKKVYKIKCLFLSLSLSLILVPRYQSCVFKVLPSKWFTDLNVSWLA